MGPHFLCCYCQTMYISEEFLNKHQKKCMHRKLHLILKMKFQLRRYSSIDDDTSNQTKNETSEDYFCEECLSGFLTLSDFERHKQEGHSEEALFRSHQSDQKYTVDAKSESLIDITPQKEKASKVTVKNQEKLKSKETNQSLGTHSNNQHTGKKAFACDQCDKRFSDKRTLKKHLLIHTGEKAFACDQCHRRFSLNVNLKRHLLIHTGEKPFACSQCHKRFAQKANLQSHLLCHSGEKPFVCDHCDKRFSRNSYLQSHLLCHSCEKPFVCNYCDKRFSLKSSLDRHLKIHC